MSALVNQAQGYLATGVSPRRLGNDHPSITPYGPVTTKDGYLLLAVGTDAQYEKLTRVLNDVTLTDRDAWRTNDERVRDRDELRTELNRIFALKSTGQWLDELSTSGVPHAPIFDVAAAFGQEQIADGDFLGTMSTPGGDVTTMRTPLVIDGHRPLVRRGPRQLGEDTRAIFDT
jgi:crotonobetainyl-CoA:carnitine CoA-transferase CaiB-like acyl-CoA transferase